MLGSNSFVRFCAFVVLRGEKGPSNRMGIAQHARRASEIPQVRFLRNIIPIPACNFRHTTRSPVARYISPPCKHCVRRHTWRSCPAPMSSNSFEEDWPDATKRPNYSSAKGKNSFCPASSTFLNTLTLPSSSLWAAHPMRKLDLPRSFPLHQLRNHHVHDMAYCHTDVMLSYQWSTGHMCFGWGPH